MSGRVWVAALALLLLACWVSPGAAQAQTYYGFDKNDYPGDDVLAALRQTFAYTGYWLSDPPGMASNPWRGKRALLRARGFGFLLLWNGRLYKDLKGLDAAALGREDARAAVTAAAQEGFPAGAILFLDQEEGGRLLPEQMAYVAAWVRGVAVGETEGVNGSRYRAGVYCSGIPVSEGAASITTEQDIRNHAAEMGGAVALWVAQDSCPPAPGCVVPGKAAGATPAPLAYAPLADALVWQYAQSPRRPQFTAACAKTYAADGNCYAPGLPQSEKSFVDLNASQSPDPSHGR